MIFNLINRGAVKDLTNLQENIFARVSFVMKKETLAQVFSCEFCEIFH